MKEHAPNRLPRVALHLIMPDVVSGPNTGKRLISSSWLAEEYDFGFFCQTRLAGGKLNVSLIKDLAKQLKLLKPDVVHISGLQSSGLHAALAARFGTDARVLLSINGFAGDDTRIGWLKRLVYDVLVEPVTLLLCHRFYVVCTEASHRRIVRLFRRKFAGVIYNPAPAIDFDVCAEREQARRNLGLLPSAFVAIVVGRMVPDKGIEFIAEAASRDALSGVSWVFVGDGPMYDEFPQRWPKLVSDGTVVLTGRVQDPKRLMAAADVFVFGTLHENLSNALLEAMAVGLPAVATRVGGNVEVVEHGVNGLLIEPANVEALVSAVERVRSLSAPDRIAWAEAARHTVSTRFTQEELLSRVGDLYEDLT